MEENNSLPEWLWLCVSRALLGEVYPEIRAIAVNLSEEKILTIRYYLDREPIEDDAESIETLETEISAMTGRDEVAQSKLECVYSDLPLGKIDVLGELVYARREYE